MPTDLLALTTLFSGGQLAVVVFLVMELRGLKDANKATLLRSEKRDEQMLHIEKKLSRLMGRLNVEDE